MHNPYLSPWEQGASNLPGQPRDIRVPFLGRPVGAGDAVRSVTEAAGVQPCSPCEQRRKALNARFRFVPWD